MGAYQVQQFSAVPSMGLLAVSPLATETGVLAAGQSLTLEDCDMLAASTDIQLETVSP